MKEMAKISLVFLIISVIIVSASILGFAILYSHREYCTVDGFCPPFLVNTESILLFLILLGIANAALSAYMLHKEA